MFSGIKKLINKSQPEQLHGVRLYFSEDGVIVAALFANLSGIYFEQPNAQFIPREVDAVKLGEAFKEAFENFAINDVNLRDQKKRDWPAFQASGLKTLKEFELSHRVASCFSLNSSNSIVRASVVHPKHADIEISVSFNPLLPAAKIGEDLILLSQLAQAS